MLRSARVLITAAVAAGVFFQIMVRPAVADTGCVISVDAQVSEDWQKAIILYNGEEEILILGTDLKSNKKAGFIRFIPFPSAPQVSLAPGNAFSAAQTLVKARGIRSVVTDRGGEPFLVPAVDLVSHQTLGSHDITAIRVDDIAGFREWVNGFFKKKNLPLKDSYPEVETVVQDYIRRGINYFVFDFVELEGPARSVEPVMYRFSYKELYYPLVASNTYGGTGRIDLIVVCPRSIGSVYEQAFKGFPYAEASTSAKVAAEELAGICPAPKDFFKGRERLYLQMISYFGTYKFDADFTADLARGVDREVAFDEIFPGDALKKELAAVPENVPGKTTLPEQKYDKFTCHKNCFTAEVPAGWRQEEDIIDSDATKEYGVTLLGPKSPEGPIPLISLLYFGPDHAMFKSAQAFIELNKAVDVDSGESATEVREITVAGRTAYSFDKETLSRMPSAGEPEEFVTVERVIVLTAKEGFYVLRYMVPESVEGNYLPVFEKAVESFKPNR